MQQIDLIGRRLRCGGHRPRSVLARATAIVVGLGLGFDTAPSAIGAPPAPDRPWADARSGSYRGLLVTGDLDPVLVRAIADRILEVHAQADAILGPLEPRGPIELEVLLFAERRDFVEVLRLERGIVAPTGPVTVFPTRTGTALAAAVPAEPGQAFFEALRAGALRHWAEGRFGTDLSGWVDEGLATWFGRALAIGDRTVPGLCDRTGLVALQEAILADTTIPFDEYLALAPGEPAVRRTVSEEIRLEQAWSMIDWMLSDPGRREAFRRYLRLMNGGYREPEARRRAFAGEAWELPAPMETSWLSFVTDRRPSGVLDAHDRLVLFAEGQRMLAADGLAAPDLDALRGALDAAGFVHEIERFGRTRRLDAADPTWLEMPPGDPSVRRSSFEAAPSRDLERAVQRGEYPQDAPRPLEIATKDLRGGLGDAVVELRIRWIALEDGTLGYLIEPR